MAKQNSKNQGPAKSALKEGVERRHRATFATDRKKGGYIVRVAGPDCDRFAGKVVPVTTKSGREDMHELDRLLWTGTDDSEDCPAQYKKVSLYSFKPKPREEDDVTF